MTMQSSLGILVMQHIAGGLVQDNKVVGSPAVYPDKPDALDPLQSMPGDHIALVIREQIERLAKGQTLHAIGIGFPGIIRDGIVAESPNLQQMKGFNLQGELSAAIRGEAAGVPIRVFNDAAVTAAGIAATQGKLNKLIRVWTLGNGIGFGRYPAIDGVWEGGHTVVTLDKNENYCGCGGRGHLEGILGLRAMRLRFLDLEPEEIFANARAGDERCAEFVKLCHRALAAATATSIHLEGPGVFYITGPDVKFLEVGRLDSLLHKMVLMSPLQGSRFEIIPTTDEVGIIGAAVNASRSLA
jgi:predicted NBD/HSP70 family sugar kinase